MTKEHSKLDTWGKKQFMFYEVLNHSAAVYGYHFYKKYCISVEDQESDCLHEEDTPYDYFAIKNCESVSGKKPLAIFQWKFHAPLSLYYN